MTKIIQKEIKATEEVEFELVKDDNSYAESVDPNNKRHYVNNKELYKEFCLYHKSKQKAISAGKDIPPLTEKIGMAIIQIANRRCNSWRFVGYSESWKQEMISQAIMTAAIRGHNFDPEKSNNPFAYLTAIINNGIIEQLKVEKRELYVKYKSIDDSDAIGVFDDDDFSNDFDMDSESSRSQPVSSSSFDETSYDDRMKYISDYEVSLAEERKRRQQNKLKQSDNELIFE